jgi:hypothetical protein
VGGENGLEVIDRVKVRLKESSPCRLASAVPVYDRSQLFITPSATPWDLPRSRVTVVLIIPVFPGISQRGLTLVTMPAA